MKPLSHFLKQIQSSPLSLITISLLSLSSTLILWLPFFLRFPIWGIRVGDRGLGTVIANFDGPYYIAIAKSLYNPQVLKLFEFNLSAEYYAAHFPLYPLLVRFFSYLVGYPYALLLVTLLSSIGASLVFYQLAKYLKLPQPFWLTTVFLFLPARFLIARSVGTPEPLFILLTLWSIHSFLKKDYWQAGFAGALAQLTKPPGALLAIAFFIALAIEYFPNIIHKASRLFPNIFVLKIFTTSKVTSLNLKPVRPLAEEGQGELLQNSVDNKDNLFLLLPWRAFPLLLIPLSLVGLFSYYAYQYGSFWAYFQSGDNIHLFWPPFQIFNTQAFWVGSFWLEDIIWLMLLITVSVIKLWKRQDVISWYALVFSLSLAFVQHRDLARYALPLAPFLIIAYTDLITHKYFKIAFAIMLLPIYLYSINFIAGNVVPISDWGKLL